MQPSNPTHAFMNEREDRWSESIYRRFLACIPENMKGTPTGFDPAIERMARDIGVSTMRIRFGDFSRGVGGDAELSSS